MVLDSPPSPAPTYHYEIRGYLHLPMAADDESPRSLPPSMLSFTLSHLNRYNHYQLSKDGDRDDSRPPILAILDFPHGPAQIRTISLSFDTGKITETVLSLLVKEWGVDGGWAARVLRDVLDCCSSFVLSNDFHRGASGEIDVRIVRVVARWSNLDPSDEVRELGRAVDVMIEEKDCAICLREFAGERQIRWLPCSHIFHDVCVLRWLERSGTCPLCRYQVSHMEWL